MVHDLLVHPSVVLVLSRLMDVLASMTVMADREKSQRWKTDNPDQSMVMHRHTCTSGL